MIPAAAAYTTVGEISDRLKTVFGEYAKPPDDWRDIVPVAMCIGGYGAAAYAAEANAGEAARTLGHAAELLHQPADVIMIVTHIEPASNHGSQPCGGPTIVGKP